jgi:hypothetical protein
MPEVTPINLVNPVGKFLKTRRPAGFIPTRFSIFNQTPADQTPADP